MKLFHLSDKGTIHQFTPRKAKEIYGFKKYVWAITERKIHNYILPRQCPRICVANIEKLISNNWIDKKEEKFKAYIFIPEQWSEIVNECVLYQYQFHPENFQVIDSIAGYYVSKKIEIPISLKPINNCLAVQKSLNVGVKFMANPQMKELKNFVTQSLTEFSIIKWDNFENGI